MTTSSIQQSSQKPRVRLDMPYFSPQIANSSPRHVDSMSLVFLQYVQDSYFLCHYYNTVLESLCWTLEQQFICSFPSVLSSPRYAPPTARAILLKASLIRSHPCLKLFCHCPESKVQIFNMFHKTHDLSINCPTNSILYHFSQSLYDKYHIGLLPVSGKHHISFHLSVSPAINPLTWNPIPPYGANSSYFLLYQVMLLLWGNLQFHILGGFPYHALLALELFLYGDM